MANPQRSRAAWLAALAAVITAASGAAGYGEMPTVFQLSMLLAAVLATVGLSLAPSAESLALKKNASNLRYRKLRYPR